MPAARLLDWRPLHKSTLIGFAKIQFSSGLTIAEIAVHRAGSRMWAAPPSRPWLDNNALVLDDRGRPKYQPIISFANHGVQSSWSRQVLKALREEHPDLFQDQYC
jgi:hypothetical protein